MRSPATWIQRAVIGLALASAVASPGNAESDSNVWFVTPAPDELYVSFEEQRRQHECAELERNPSAEQINCWARYLFRKSSRVYSVQKDSQAALACFPGGWVVRWSAELVGTSPSESAGCPLGKVAARCVRPALDKGWLFGMFGGEEVLPAIPIQSTIDRVVADTNSAVREYTEFQYLRRGHSRNRHTAKIAALALSHGMLVLYRAQTVLEYERRLLNPPQSPAVESLESGPCGVSFLQPYFDRARAVIDEVGGSDIPSILESYPPPNSPWSRKFYELQLALLGSAQSHSSSEAWIGICTEVKAAEGELGGHDADLNAWCGFGYWINGDAPRAEGHWRAARKSANHPDAVSYASFALRRARDEGDAR